MHQMPPIKLFFLLADDTNARVCSERKVAPKGVKAAGVILRGVVMWNTNEYFTDRNASVCVRFPLPSPRNPSSLRLFICS